MRKLIVFNQVSLDGYICDASGDMSWAHKSDPEWNDFVAGNASGDATLVFGRVTYEMMASFWPTPMAAKSAPVVAKRMNEFSKLVFSRTLEKTTWQNSTLVKGDPAAAVRKMKKEPGNDLVIFGSASIVALLTEAGLIDEYQIIVNPIVLGSGKGMFDGVKKPRELALSKTRAFKNGNVLLDYTCG